MCVLMCCVYRVHTVCVCVDVLCVEYIQCVCVDVLCVQSTYSECVC